MRRVLAVIFTLLVNGCTPHVFSPPAGSFLVESSETVGAGKHGVRGEFFAGGALFGPEVLSARASYRHGVSDELELSAAPAIISVLGGRAGDSSPNVYALRVGAKYAPVKHVALVGGLGGGSSAAGGFVSPDLGVIGAYENPYFVPFVSARGLISAPVAARTVHFTVDDGAGDTDDEDDLPDEYRQRPELTYGLQLSVGARLPLPYDPIGDLRPSIACAIGITSLYDDRHDEGYAGGSCAFDLAF